MKSATFVFLIVIFLLTAPVVLAVDPVNRGVVVKNTATNSAVPILSKQQKIEDLNAKVSKFISKDKKEKVLALNAKLEKISGERRRAWQAKVLALQKVVQILKNQQTKLVGQKKDVTAVRTSLLQIENKLAEFKADLQKEAQNDYIVSSRSESTALNDVNAAGLLFTNNQQAIQQKYGQIVVQIKDQIEKVRQLSQ